MLMFLLSVVISISVFAKNNVVYVGTNAEFAPFEYLDKNKIVGFDIDLLDAISPGPWPRQRPGRYAFRAGRNLPDKEFRYLRTVIVTAAVYRGLASGLRLRSAEAVTAKSHKG